MIATVGPCLPIDLIAATNRLSGPLGWQLDLPTPRADEWLESRFPRWARSITEQWAEGQLDDHEAVVFSRGEDVTQRLYYYICELQRREIVGGPRPIIFDVAKILRPSSEQHTIASVRRLAEELELDDVALAGHGRHAEVGDAHRRAPVVRSVGVRLSAARSREARPDGTSTTSSAAR